MKRILAITFFFYLSGGSALAGTQCASDPWTTFIQRFQTDAVFSKERTRWPLKLTEESIGHSAEKTVKKIYSYSQYWNGTDSLSGFLAANPSVKIDARKETSHVGLATFYIEDADVLFTMHFRISNGCWKLIWLQDTDQDRH